MFAKMRLKSAFRSRYMFWTDWSSANPRVSRSYMDGSNVQAILTGTNQVHWPNGLAIDEGASLLYITDAYLDWIGHCNLDGSGFKVIIRNHPLVQHPYSLGIFKAWNSFSYHLTWEGERGVLFWMVVISVVQL